VDLVRVCLSSPETVGLEAGNRRVARLLPRLNPLLLSLQSFPFFFGPGLIFWPFAIVYLTRPRIKNLFGREDTPSMASERTT